MTYVLLVAQNMFTSPIVSVFLFYHRRPSHNLTTTESVLFLSAARPMRIFILKVTLATHLYNSRTRVEIESCRRRHMVHTHITQDDPLMSSSHRFVIDHIRL